jgi:hypothetical protein
LPLSRRLYVGNESVSDVMGFLTIKGVLYCSPSCASDHGISLGNDVDQDEYESLVESESVRAVSLCPTCESEFAVSWPEREPS